MHCDSSGLHHCGVYDYCIFWYSNSMFSNEGIAIAWGFGALLLLQLILWDLFRNFNWLEVV
jgi:hypothetical protein